MANESVTEWLDGLRAGSDEAVGKIWHRYFETLVQYAKKKLTGTTRRVADEEDVALSALESFCRNAAAGKFPNIKDREGLWKILFTVTEYKVLDQLKFQRRRKRGDGAVRGESVFFRQDDSTSAGLDNAKASPEPTPEFAAELGEQMRLLLDDLGDDMLREIAIMKMEGYHNEEIALKFDTSPRSVTRKLKVIRTIWSERLS